MAHRAGSRALVVALWGFLAALDALGVSSVPLLLSLGFALAAGSLVGFVASHRLDETAGFVSPILTAMAAIGAVAAIVGGETLFHRAAPVATDHLRFIVVGTSIVVASAWVLRNTLLDA